METTACLPACLHPCFVSGTTLHYISAAWYAHVTSTFYCHKTLPLPQTNKQKHKAEEQLQSTREHYKGRNSDRKGRLDVSRSIKQVWISSKYMYRFYFSQTSDFLVVVKSLSWFVDFVWCHHFISAQMQLRYQQVLTDRLLYKFFFKYFFLTLYIQQFMCKHSNFAVSNKKNGHCKILIIHVMQMSFLPYWR